MRINFSSLEQTKCIGGDLEGDSQNIKILFTNIPEYNACAFDKNIVNLWIEWNKRRWTWSKY